MQSGSADLVEVRVWFRLANTIKVSNIDKLEVKEEAGIGSAELRPQTDVRQIAELLVAPVVQLTYTAINSSVIFILIFFILCVSLCLSVNKLKSGSRDMSCSIYLNTLQFT